MAAHDATVSPVASFTFWIATAGADWSLSSMLRLLVSVVVLCLAARMGAAQPLPGSWKLPVIEGRLEGDWSEAISPGGPALHWSITATAPRSRERALALGVDGSGVKLRVEATLDPQGDGAWRSSEAQLDLAVWWPVLAAQFFPAQAAWDVRGAVQVAAEGTMRDGQIAGRLELDVRDAALGDAAKVWSVTGIAVRGQFGHLPSFALDEPVRVQFREAVIAGVALRDGTVEVALAADGTVRVTRAECGVLEGRITLTPFELKPGQREVRTTVEFTAVDLGSLGKFLPSALADARGLVSGRMELGWDLSRGLTVASGALRPGGGKSAAIKLTPAPGFLTERLPLNMRERISLLPEWLGPMRKLFAPANPAYPILRAIELGESSLDVTEFEIGLSLDGDARGRSAHIVAMTRPTVRGTVVDSVRFEFNVTGPLADLVRLLAGGRVNLNLR